MSSEQDRMVAERNLAPTEAIDVPVPSDELRDSIGEHDVVRVQDVPKQADHFSKGYRRC